MTPMGNLAACVIALVAAQADPDVPASLLSVDLIGWTEGQPWVQMQLTPGGRTGDAGWWIREQRLIFNVYGPDYDTSYTLASKLFSMLTDKQVAPGWTSNGVAISDTEGTMELAWLPDPLTSKPRFTFEIAFTAVPAAT